MKLLFQKYDDQERIYEQESVEMKGCILITGASSGFGAACAERFYKEGWRIVLIARRLERMKALTADFEDKSRIYITQADIRDLKATEKALGDVPDAFSGVEVLVNNAGLALGLGPAHEQAVEDWETMIDTNIKGLLYCTRLLLPGMVERKKGHIVNIGSIAGDWPYPGGNVYGATKAFVKQFSRNLRTDLLGTPVRVTNIEPGMAETEFSLVRHKGDSVKASRTYEGLKPLTGADIAEIVHWTVNLPAHVNINSVEAMPVSQAWDMLAVHRDEENPI